MLTIEVTETRPGPGAPVKHQVEAPVSLGSDAHNKIVVAGDHIAPEHAHIFREGTDYCFQNLGGVAHPSSVHRGGETLVTDGTKPITLRHGDFVHLGDPARPVVLYFDIPDETVTVERKVQFTDFAAVAARVARQSEAAPRLLEVTQRLARSGLDQESVFEAITDSVFDLLPRATHVAIALADARFETVYCRTRYRSAGVREESFKVPRAVIARVEKERDAFVAPDAPVEFSSSATSMHLGITSAIGAPLWEGERIRGVLHVYNRDSAEKFDADDLALMVTLTGQATLAIESALLFQRLKVAEERARGENRFLKTREERRRSIDMIGESPAMQAIVRQIDRVKDTRATVCIEGETGTGKELIASAIHYQSLRRDKMFVAENCAAVPENLLESELFGHKKGAFTGADHEKKGLFEIAEGGTLFLDEIGEMSLGLQAKLLRVLQESEIRPVGATTPKKIDVRIICATNRALEKEVEKGTFRQDLYYRLKQYPMRLPPLRERREDVPGLVTHFLRKYVEEMKKPILGVTPEAMDQLVAYAWPGNIRELENEVQRVVIQADADAYVTPDLLSPQINKVEELLGRVAPKKGTLKDRVEEVERWLLTEALRDHGGNKTRTAETLGITREGLHKKLSKYGM